MSFDYTNRLAALYERKKIPFVVYKGVFWHVYNRMVEPRCPHSVVIQISEEEAEQLRKKLGGLLIRWTGAFRKDIDDFEKTWYAVVSYQNIDIEKINSKKRSLLKKSLSNCKVKRIDIDFMATYGYRIYQKAHQRYQNNKSQLISEEKYKADLFLERNFDDLIHYFGVFVDNQLVGYTKVYVFEKEEANYSVTKFDPDYFKYGIGDASAYKLSQYYLDEKRVNYICSGLRTLEHQTNVQDFYMRKYNFQKVAIPLFIRYGPKLRIPMQMMRPFKNSFGKLNPKLDALLKMDQLKNG